MTYTNCITLNDALYFDLFDEIPYRQVKQFFEKEVDRNEFDFEVCIEKLPCDIPAYGKVSFTFTLMVDINVNGSLSIMRPKQFIKEIEYNTSSAYALKLIDLQRDEEEEDDENAVALGDEEDEDEEEEQQEIKVRRFEFENKKYFKSFDNKLYDTDTNQEIGYYCPEEQKIVIV